LKYSSSTNQNAWLFTACSKNAKKSRKELMNIKNYFTEEPSNMRKKNILAKGTRTKAEK